MHMVSFHMVSWYFISVYTRKVHHVYSNNVHKGNNESLYFLVATMLPIASLQKLKIYFNPVMAIIVSLLNQVYQFDGLHVTEHRRRHKHCFAFKLCSYKIKRC